jgi:hypothetical protein
MSKEPARVQKINANISKTTITRITLELDQESIEEILSEWLLCSSKDFFANSISFNWQGYDIPRVLVTGEKVS